MGTFYTGCRIENHIHREKRTRIPKLLVDTGSEYTWVLEKTLKKIRVAPEKKDISFIMANGQIVTRSVGFANVRIDKYFTIDEIVFAQDGDMQLLGARTLEGLNLTVDSRQKNLLRQVCACSLTRQIRSDGKKCCSLPLTLLFAAGYLRCSPYNFSGKFVASLLIAFYG